MHNPIHPGLVSTIIPVFNRPVMVREAIESVLAQVYRPIEIIVVNDGSTDATHSILVSMATVHPEIQLIEQANGGPGAAREAGRQLASGEFVQYLDCDDLLLPGKFSQQVAALEAHPECGVAYGKTELIADAPPCYETAWKRTGEKIETMFPSFLTERWWGTSTPLYRRQLTDRVGAWSAKINEEDWEYDCRIAALDTRLAYVEKFVSVQRQHGGNISSHGNTDRLKLAHRCDARIKMYASALSSQVPIPVAEMHHFSKSVFLLGRQCAAAGLDECCEKMLELAIRAHGKANFKHRVFKLIGKGFGWQAAARFAGWWERR